MNKWDDVITFIGNILSSGFTQSVIQKLRFLVTFIILTQRFIFVEWLGMLPTLAFNVNSDIVYDLVKVEVVKSIKFLHTRKVYKYSLEWQGIVLIMSDWLRR